MNEFSSILKWAGPDGKLTTAASQWISALIAERRVAEATIAAQAALIAALDVRITALEP